MIDACNAECRKMCVGKERSEAFKEGCKRVTMEEMKLQRLQGKAEEDGRE